MTKAWRWNLVSSSTFTIKWHIQTLTEIVWITNSEKEYQIWVSIRVAFLTDLTEPPVIIMREKNFLQDMFLTYLSCQSAFHTTSTIVRKTSDDKGRQSRFGYLSRVLPSKVIFSLDTWKPSRTMAFTGSRPFWINHCLTNQLGFGSHARFYANNFT